jgi:hypothetical protein
MLGCRRRKPKSGRVFARGRRLYVCSLRAGRVGRSSGSGATSGARRQPRHFTFSKNVAMLGGAPIRGGRSG